MRSFRYKLHIVVYGAAFDRFTGLYAPTGQIVWQEPKGLHGSRSFTLAELFETSSAAAAVALKEASTWTDERLNGST
jgi:hypothetical protein